ncbi:hypothetical protein PR202_gb25148 [Eleusine coracana subsp. coracana]|uniref:Gnk2-homologous domain-containing protein n=1 Tax=Eleusine coracana subsp. coracana TaxID=191504 RepID=A0AAV5FPV3_ELECO|nr:hypothetical protein QOZ80_5BG0456100 [Eleusine coracana subsp. coracana]GJN36301.1 hypothetical protein PR202_gb25148 [Eleusine coracana subsp. coracana]
MASSSPALLLMVFAAAMVAISPQLCSAVEPIATYCSKNFTGSPQKQKSINQVLSSLVPSPTTFYTTATAGRGAAAAWGQAQCRGDIPASDCALCLAAAQRELAAACSGSADGRVWYDYCFMRYDDADFLGLPDTGYTLILLNTMNASNPVAFDRAERKLMARVAKRAGDGEEAGLVRETEKLDGTTTIYGLGWCTKDISTQSCGLCVAQAVAEMPNYCTYRRGCRVIYTSCMARYETYPFFFPVDGKADSGAASSSHAGEYQKVVLNA